jgi:hypothetical protein
MVSTQDNTSRSGVYSRPLASVHDRPLTVPGLHCCLLCLRAVCSVQVAGEVEEGGWAAVGGDGVSGRA